MAQSSESICVWVGTYTRHGQSEGIYVYRLQVASGAFEHVQTVGNLDDPSYLALAPGGRCLYAVNELPGDGAVTAFAVEPASGQLRLLNSARSGGAHPAHVSVDPTGRWVLVANYTGGTIASLPVQGDGSLGEAADVVRHAGSGPNAARQEGPHPHMIVTDPAGVFAFVPDLGLDRIVVYRLDRSSGQLIGEKEAGAQLHPGAGPRHVAFGKNGRHLYCVNELDLTVSVFEYDAANGHTRTIQTLSSLPPDVTNDGSMSAAAIVVHPSGQFVYASNRGHNSIAIFGVDQASGQLTPLGHAPSGGRTPRDINVDPSGSLLLAANQDSDAIASFRIDARSGALEPGGSLLRVPKPVRVLFG
jgi:6-phosphogluconolactonase